MATVIKAEGISKQYRLGKVTGKTFYEDVLRSYYRLRGKDDPFRKFTEINDRSTTGNSDYVWALRDLSFEVAEGEVLGIVGKNGAGKSTLLKILSKVTSPTSGSVRIKGKIASLLEVGTGFHPELSGRDNIFLNGSILGMQKKEIEKKLSRIIEFSGVERYIDTPVKRYSSGMYVRLAFAVAAHLEPDILIVDEVLAVGDVEFQKKCLGKMKEVSERDGRTVLFVSHNLNAVQHLCDKALLINNGLLEMRGRPADVINTYLSNRKIFSSVYTGENAIKRAEVSIVSSGNSYPAAVLEVDFSTLYPIRSLTLGINIKDEMDVCLVGVNNKHYLEDVLNHDNKTNGKIKVTFPELQLLPGKYHVDLFLTNAFKPFEVIRDALSFEIPERQITKTAISFDRNINKVFMDNIKWELK